MPDDEHMNLRAYAETMMKRPAVVKIAQDKQKVSNH